MNSLIAHRGPDGEGFWNHPHRHVGFGHRRLSIIDLATGHQPMSAPDGSTITYNGELYNYRDLRRELESSYQFRTTSDTEVLLAAYLRWGADCVHHLRGMFAFAIWDNTENRLFCARDHFGIKPFYQARVGSRLFFASEAKALLPFLPSIETEPLALQEYFTFQFPIGAHSLFKGVDALLPGHLMIVTRGNVEVRRYWEPRFELDWDHTKRYFHSRVRELIEDSVTRHLMSDVPVGAYLSGGIDSSLVATLARRSLLDQASDEKPAHHFPAFTGKFSVSSEYDESPYARSIAQKNGLDLHEIDITAQDFLSVIPKVVYHLDYPVAGPGSFPQYMVSKLARSQVKVCLGGQGGDEIFGGYVRYLLAYFEQCIRGAIDGTMHSGNYIVTYESIIPSLSALRSYKPLMKEFFRSGLFDDREKRYFRLVSRSESILPLLAPGIWNGGQVFESFREIFCGENVAKASYFDSMTNFDFKTLLPALLQVEDRVSMAHGLESRVPLIDLPLIEFAATIPSNVKFENGELKLLIRQTFQDALTPEVLGRKDKMGFPVPLGEWIKTDLFEFISDTFASDRSQSRGYLRDGFSVQDLISREGKFDRNLWGLLCLELWQQQFHDRAEEFRTMGTSPVREDAVGENGHKREGEWVSSQQRSVN